MKSEPNLRRYNAVLTVFTVAMLGMVLSDNMISFFLFWETTSVCSFLLVGTNIEKKKARESARQALFVTVGGGLLLLVAIVLISRFGVLSGLTLADSLRFSFISSQIIHSSMYPWVVGCLVLAIASKSAQFPFHIWLPSAMAGPTPVSSFLHSATMVKAGIYLLARLTPTLGGSTLWVTTFTVLGATTMVVGALLSASQRDIKKILAYSTVAVLGILVMLLGIGTDIAIKAAVVYLVAHAFYKASLFQIIGNIDYATGSRDLKTLGSLAKVMPFTAAAALASCLSMAGAPPLFGFFGKELAYLAKIQLDTYGLLLISAAVFTNILLVGLALSICYRPFWSRNKIEGEINSVPFAMVASPLVFALVGLFIGLFPAYFDQNLGSQMATAIGGRNLDMKLKLWHGVNLESLVVLGLSLLTLGVGIFTAFKINPVIVFMSTVVARAQPYGPAQLYQKIFSFIPYACTFFMGRWQNGDLNRYIQITLLATIAIVATPIMRSLFILPVSMEVGFTDFTLFLFIALPAFACVLVRNTILRIILFGVSGFGVVVFFLISGAPDLALTQLLVECLVLIFVLLLLPSISLGQAEKRNYLNISIAALMGLFILLMVILKPQELGNETASFFLDSSYAKAFGKNVVNVILVDFRALDTFGEVVVVSIAALGVGSLLRMKEQVKENG